MCPARFLEALDQHLVRGIQEKQLIIHPAPDIPVIKNLPQRRKIAAGANVNAQGSISAAAFSFQKKLCKFSDQRNRQIVRAVVAHILQGLQGNGFSCAAHTCYNQKLPQNFTSGSRRTPLCS